MRNFALLCALAAVAAPSGFAECKALPACAYLGAPVVFLGQAGGIEYHAGQTVEPRYRFRVQDAVKGLPKGAAQATLLRGAGWRGEGFEAGEFYIVFATPAPASSNGGEPTFVSYSCSGPLRVSGGAAAPGARTEMAMLRAYKEGQKPPAVFGDVFQVPFHGWPEYSGVPVAGAKVTISRGRKRYSTETDQHGIFRMEEAPPGEYDVRAERAPYRLLSAGTLNVPAGGCGFASLQMQSTGVVRGMALDHRGLPAPGANVELGFFDSKGKPTAIYMSAPAAADGQFEFTGVPDAAFTLAAGYRLPRAETPYAANYYPATPDRKKAAVFRLKPGEWLPPLVVWLEAPRALATLAVKAVDRTGRAVADAPVRAERDGVALETARTNGAGLAQLRCVKGETYDLRAGVALPQAAGPAPPPENPVVCEARKEPLKVRVER